MVNLIKIFGIGVVILIVGAVLVAGYLGFVPGVSDIMGTNKARNLGVVTTSADYASGIAKVPGLTVTNPQGACVTCNYLSTGSVPVNTTFTQEEFTAQMNAQNSTKGPFRDAQFKFNKDGTVETSGMLVDPRISGPVYLKGKIISAAGKNVTIDVSYAELGRIPIPADQMQQVKQIANDQIQTYFAKNPGSSVTSLTIEDGKVQFNGTLPQSVVGEAQ